jgi:hypothetical protein
MFDMKFLVQCLTYKCSVNASCYCFHMVGSQVNHDISLYYIATIFLSKKKIILYITWNNLTLVDQTIAVTLLVPKYIQIEIKCRTIMSRSLIYWQCSQNSLNCFRTWHGDQKVNFKGKEISIYWVLLCDK